MATFVYRATFIFQEGLRCCHMALISLRFFRKNLGNLRDFFGQMVYRPPWQKISRTPMGSAAKIFPELAQVEPDGRLKNIKSSTRAAA